MSQIQPLSPKFCQNFEDSEQIFYATDLFFFDLYFHITKLRFSFHMHFKIRIQLLNSCSNYMLNFMSY